MSTATAAAPVVKYTTQEQVLDAMMRKLISTQEASKLLDSIKPPAPVQGLRFKVSEKGALSVYGLQARFPVTLYAGQWERLLEVTDKLKEFIADNAATLSRKS